MEEKRFNKKSQGLSFNVIITAVIALVVLVVVVAIFTKETGKSINTLESCEGRGGQCKTTAEGCKPEELKVANVECPKEKPLCCVKIFEE